MGYYINPTDGSTKEEWLEKNGKEISFYQAIEFDPSSNNESALVVWMDNGFFTALGVAYSRDERDAFLAPDPRPMRYYLVPITSLNRAAGLGNDWPEYYEKIRTQ